MQCIICLSDEGEVVQKGCCCRGDAGAVHIDCMIEVATHESEHRNSRSAWHQCSTCTISFTSDVSLALAKAWMAHVESGRANEREIASAKLNMAMELEWLGEYVEAEADRKSVM